MVVRRSRIACNGYTSREREKAGNELIRRCLAYGSVKREDESEKDGGGTYERA